MAKKKKTKEIEDEKLEEVVELEDVDEEEQLEDTDEKDDKEKKLEEQTALAIEYLDGWQRERAAFDNYKKRIEKDRVQMNKDASGRVIRRYLDILDDLELALQNKPLDEEGAVWADGIELVYRKLKGFLEADGVKPMGALGEQFNPTQHEAVLQRESEEHESGEIIEVLQQGYTIGEKVLRPAKVLVAV